MFSMNKPTAQRAFDLLLIFLAACFCCGWALDDAHLSGTEGFRAITAHQMAESGGPQLVPRLYGTVYLRKPPLIYWVLSGFERLTGIADEWLWRLPSVLAAALLCVGIAWFCGRWWGRRAGRTAGWACLALVALWSQSRSADLDAVNTLFAASAAFCLIELHTLPRPRSWLWMLAGGLALGGALLTKGPAAMPLILGAFLGPVVIHRRWSSGWRRELWGVLLIGAALFGVFMTAIYFRLQSLQLPVDASGLQETADRMVASDWRQFFQALLLPPTLLAYGLPVSAALFFVLRASFLQRLDPAHRHRALSLAGALVVSFAAGIVSGMTNPRYGYINLPLLAPFAGIIAYASQSGALTDAERRMLYRAGLFLGGLLLTGLSVWGLLARSHGTAPTLAPLALLLLAGATGLIRSARKKRTAPLSAALVMLLLAGAVVFAHEKNRQREERSAYTAARQLAEVVDTEQPVVTGLMLWTHPELFYYAGIDVKPYNRYRFETPFPLEESRAQVVFHAREWPEWKAAFSNELETVRLLDTHVPGARLAHWRRNRAP